MIALGNHNHTNALSKSICIRARGHVIALCDCDRPVTKEAREAIRNCRCQGLKLDLCSPFSRRELQHAIGKLKLGSAPGEDEVSNEMLRQLGPTAEQCA